MKKNLKDILTGKGIKEKQKYLIGKICEVVANGSGSGIPIGVKIEILSVTDTSNGRGGKINSFKRLDTNAVPASWCYVDELVLASGETQEEINEENDMLKDKIKELKENIETNILKIKFMKENSLKNFDDTDFKVYKTLSLLEDPNLSKLDKAKAISSLIKG